MKMQLKAKFRVARIFLAVYMLVFTLELLCPLRGFAITTGPSQPEVQSFEPSGTTDMVSLFSGDFTYNIPLFELPGPNGGYPFNLAYHSGATMDEEASWVGLGWNLNPGVVNRNMRGLPDDFDGDLVKTDLDIKKNWTVSTGVSVAIKLWGYDFGKPPSEGPNTGQLSPSINVKYNSYRGFGTAIGLGISNETKSGSLTGSVGLGISLDSDEGATFDVDGSLGGNVGKNDKDQTNTLTGCVGLGINSRSGLKNLTLNLKPYHKKAKTEGTSTSRGKKANNFTGGGAANISFSTPAFTPHINMPMKGFNLSLSFKLGGDGGGAFGNIGFSASYNEQKLKYITKKSAAYGYLHLEDAEGSANNENPSTMLDINREKDGMLTRYTPNLAAPCLTYDILSVVGQGMMGEYRPYRNDIGAAFDEYSASKSAGGGLGVEFGMGEPEHLGLNGEINFSQSWSGKWQHLTSFGHDFMSGVTNSDFENVYFKSTGELTSEDDNRFNEIVGGEGALKLNLTGDRTSPALTDIFSDANDNTNNSVLSNAARDTVSRKPRGTSIVPLTNNQISSLNEYAIQYYDSASNILGGTLSSYKNATMTTLDRNNRTGYDNTPFSIAKHIGGITAVNNEGMRYIYGIPAYNNKHVEATFSIPGPGTDTNSYCTHLVNINSTNGVPNYHCLGTDEYNHKTSLPPFAHSYLLTAIVGPDYVDVDNNGPSENDLGYWVKFSYTKATNSYKWRAPYNSSQANYLGGYQSDQYDDKASYMYGEREVWYLATAETKTHKAVFYMSARHDGNEANGELGGTASNKSYKLDSIQLFIKKDYDNLSNPKPIQTVRFNYDYSLCGSVPNNDGLTETIGGTNINANAGKLTLKSVYSTYENSVKGALSPYVFQYGNFKNASGTTANSNPNYDPFAYDRWGNFKPDGSECDKVIFPYVNQNMSKSERDSSVVAWHLTDIHTPSGSDIHVSYESKDYAYVQDKAAMQMFPIVSLGDTTHPNVIYSWSSLTSSNRHAPCDQDRKIYFPLNHPIPLTDSMPDTTIAKYVDDGTGQVYFKVHAYMKKNNENAEYVSGYLDVLSHGVDTGCLDGAHQNYIRGYVLVDYLHKNGSTPIMYNPLTYLILQSLKLNLPQFAYKGNLTTSNPGARGAKLILEMCKSIGAAFADIKELFNSYYNSRTNYVHQWASTLDLSQSFIRLNCPDKIKYGGGARVSQIQIADNWNKTTGEAASVYGTAYDYTTIENNVTISSGVATYEPQIGGEENALRYGKNYPQRISATTKELLCYEYPINETYYPAPSIGYSRVTVRSINTGNILGGKTTGLGYGSTGVTENDFYTAKDYPVITAETPLSASKNSASMKYINLPIPLPGLGSLGWDILAGSQGYYIELNDMHGKPHQVINYGLDAMGRKDTNAVSLVTYTYLDTVITYQKPGQNKIYTARRLKNEVPVLLNDQRSVSDTSVQIVNKLVGVDYEMFTDQRQSKSWTAGGGLDFNIELVFPAIPIPIPWPNISYQENDLSVAVTNKIIQRSGILTQVVATDGQSTVTTNNLVYDQYTGRPLLTTVNNDFDDLIWSYHIPAYLKFDQMGPAYKNIGLTLNIPSDSIFATGVDTVYQIAGFSACKYLVPGDEFVMGGGYKGIVTQSNGGDSATFILTNAGTFTLTTSSNTINYSMYLVRSGRRNQLQTDAGVITALKDPTHGRIMNTCYDTFYVPNTYTPAVDTCFSTVDVSTFVDSIVSWLGDTTGVAFIPLNDPRFQNDTSFTNPLIAQGYTGMEVAISSITFINTHGGNCSWDFYGFNCDGTPQLRPLPIAQLGIVSFPYTPNAFDSAYDARLWECNSPPQTLNGFTYAGSGMYQSHDARFVLYQNPNNCFCNNLYPAVTTYTPVYVSDTVIGIDSVINATANVYTDNWSNDFSNMRFEDDGNYYMRPYYLNHENDYQNGKKGIWRDWMNFTYYTDRRQDPDTVNTRRDGTFLMSLFNWQQPLINHCDSNWVRVKEITEYNGYNYEVENRDPLGIYSSALYSYSGKLPIAVGANTHNAEFGFEGFEEYQHDSLFNQYQNATGNIDITTQTLFYTAASGGTYFSNIPVWGVAPYLEATYDYLLPSNISGISPNTTYSGCTFTPNNSSPGWNSVLAQNLAGGYTEQTIPNTSGASTSFGFIFNSTPAINTSMTLVSTFEGTLSVPHTYYQPGSITTTNITRANISDSRAHTGKHSLQVTDSISFQQPHLSFLNKNEQYQFSAWVSRDDPNTNVSSYGYLTDGSYYACGVEILAFDSSNNLLGTVGRFYPSGNMINKWQKIEGSFSLNYPNAQSIAIRFYPGATAPSYTTIASAYFDDIRIFPSRGNMKSYVYNNSDYRLAAVLDDNNYATLYYYDEEGQLYLTKQETEKGIYTVQEARENMPR